MLIFCPVMWKWTSEMKHDIHKSAALRFTLLCIVIKYLKTYCIYVFNWNFVLRESPLRLVFYLQPPCQSTLRVKSLIGWREKSQMCKHIIDRTHQYVYCTNAKCWDENQYKTLNPYPNGISYGKASYWTKNWALPSPKWSAVIYWNRSVAHFICDVDTLF